MMEPRFFICRHCGNIVTFIHSSGAPLSCCGDIMEELIAGTTDAAVEKHVPIVERKGNTVTVRVGAVTHPMTAEHYIMWIALNTKEGLLWKELTPADPPEAIFTVEEGETVTAYAFCNLHQLWKS